MRTWTSAQGIPWLTSHTSKRANCNTQPRNKAPNQKWITIVVNSIQLMKEVNYPSTQMQGCRKGVLRVHIIFKQALTWSSFSFTKVLQVNDDFRQSPNFVLLTALNADSTILTILRFWMRKVIEIKSILGQKGRRRIIELCAKFCDCMNLFRATC